MHTTMNFCIRTCNFLSYNVVFLYLKKMCEKTKLISGKVPSRTYDFHKSSLHQNYSNSTTRKFVSRKINTSK